jgi:hypothetical protein
LRFACSAAPWLPSPSQDLFNEEFDEADSRFDFDDDEEADDDSDDDQETPKAAKAATGSKSKSSGATPKGPKTAPVKRRVDKTDVQYVSLYSIDSDLTPARALQGAKRPKVTIHYEHEEEHERAPRGKQTEDW